MYQRWLMAACGCLCFLLYAIVLERERCGVCVLADSLVCSLLSGELVSGHDLLFFNLVPTARGCHELAHRVRAPRKVHCGSFSQQTLNQIDRLLSVRDLMQKIAVSCWEITQEQTS